ncbi:MAG TPA: BamA/TamA family outer membrane protein [Vicinamibacterales bacterium]|nr:BamA/TamA family outer membrane protein [Vicinamibacterales bacterium]
MFTYAPRVLAVSALMAVFATGSAAAQAPTPDQTSAQAPASAPGAPLVITPCKNEVPVPLLLDPATKSPLVDQASNAPVISLPPAGSPPVLWQIEVCFPKQDNAAFVPIESYLFYMKADDQPRSTPSNGTWVPYTAAFEQTLRDDFKSLWAQGLLEDLSIEVTDAQFPNGTVGRIVSFVMEERDRVKIVSYEGSKQLDRSKLEEQLRERKMEIAADSLLDERRIKQVEAVVRDMLQEKGFTADVTSTITRVEGKTVNLTFHIVEGRKVKIRKVDWVGNKDIKDGKLTKQMKENKPGGLLGWITGGGTWNATKYEEDAERVREYYQNHGYANATIGQPELKVLENSKDGKKQWIELKIPVTEGQKYTFGSLDFDGLKVFKPEYIHGLYEVKEGETYSRKKLVEGNRRTQEVYGRYGFMDFTAAPDLVRSDSANNPDTALSQLVPEALALEASGPGAKPPHVDVTIRVTEGEQFIVRRISFTGNTTTRDNVIRRELSSLVEGSPFDTNALKDSVRRLNQLGYFKPLEGNEKDVKVDKTTNATNMVDVTFKLEEQNRNQLTFGAGISQYEGFFGQLAFQTSNFLGRGETFSVSLQGGERAQNYQVGFTEPFLFDRNITGGIDIHKRSLQYVGYYTQKSTGGSLVFGMPLAPWTRAFLNYSYEEVSITDVNEALIDNSCVFSQQGCSTISSLSDTSQLTETQIKNLCQNPFVCDSFLIGQGGKRTISKIVPTVVHNTVNHPIFPTTGKKYTASVDLAVLGGNTQYIKPHFEYIRFFRHTSRTTLGLRAQFEYITPVRNTRELPVFERLFLGGEYSVRGFDIRSIGPTVPNSLVVLGGNKSLLFNAEYAFSIADPVRLLVFYDAGQVRDFGEPFGWYQPLTRIVVPELPPVIGAFGDIVTDPGAIGVRTETIGKTSAFKTSTGVELRFFMPVLNVPFRLIYAWNPQRGGVLDNNLQPTKASVFKFSVGTTF